MAVDLLALVATAVVAAVVENSVIPENGCGRSSGIWTSSQSLRKTSINSTQTLPAGLWYVVGVIFKMLRNGAENVLPVARVSVTQSAITPFNLLYVFFIFLARG